MLIKRLLFRGRQYIPGFIILALIVGLSIATFASFLRYAIINQNWSIEALFTDSVSFAFGFLLITFIVWFSRNLYLASRVQALNTQFKKARSPWSWYRVSFYVFLGIDIFALLRYSNSGALYDLVTAYLFGCILITYLILWLLAIPRRRKLLDETFTYGHGTVGKAQNDNDELADLLGFTKSAAAIRAALDKTLKDPVTVFAITGGMGKGKSTYWRVIAEGLDKSKKMHTYISLTETNSENDFSKLFAERWFETLSQRYPILFSFSYTRHLRLYNILRGFNGGFLKDVLRLMQAGNTGVFRTAGIYYEETAEAKNEFIKPTIANMFGHIPTIYEDQWFIVIDEMERAPFDETYRVIEVIERFKQQARNGFPIRITFVLCIDQNRLEHLLETHKELSEKTSLIKDFMMGGAKNIDFKATLPVQDTNEKLEFIRKRLVAILPLDGRAKKSSKILRDIWDEDKDEFKAIDNVDIGPDGLNDPYERYSYVMHQLINESPRLVLKTIRQKKFQIEAFLEDKDSWVHNHRISEYLIFSYLLVKLEEKALINMAKEVFAQLGPDEPTRRFHEMSDPVMLGSDDDKPINVRERLYMRYGFDYRYLKNDSDLRAILEPLRVLIPKVYKNITGDKDLRFNDEIQYQGTLSERALFMSLVNFRDEKDDVSIFLSYFDKVREDTWDKNIFTSAKIIDDFSGFVRNHINWQQRTKDISFFLAKHIFEYIENPNEKRLVEPGNANIDDNLLDGLTYEFIFQLTDAFNLNSKDASQNEECIKLMENFLRSKKITVEAKLIFVDAFLRSDASDFERTKIMKDIIEQKRGDNFLPDAFDKIQKEMVDRYNNARSTTTIHNTEANVFYVLHQSWDGKVGEDSNLGTLRAIARKGLKTGSYGLETLWSVYPHNPEWKNYRDFKDERTNMMFFIPSDRGRYITLREMLAYSNSNSDFRKKIAVNQSLQDKIAFWQKVAEDTDFQKDEGDVGKVGVGEPTVAIRIAAKREAVDLVKNKKHMLSEQT